jgi:hypothetical protein
VGRGLALEATAAASKRVETQTLVVESWRLPSKTSKANRATHQRTTRAHTATGAQDDRKPRLKSNNRALLDVRTAPLKEMRQLQGPCGLKRRLPRRSDRHSAMDCGNLE